MPPTPETQTETLKTADQVALAAHDLLRQGQGQAITQRKIYEAIGNRGSMKTIQQALGEFWADLGTHLQQLEYLQGFPPEALSALLEAFARIRAQAEARARADFEAETQAANEAVEVAQAERTAALDALETAQSQINELKHQVDQLVEKRDGLQQQLESETDRRQALEGEIPAIREDAEARLQQAKQQQADLQETLAKEEARHQATETRLTALYDQERTARAEERTQAVKTQESLQGKLEDLNQTYLAAKQAGAQLASQLSQEVARQAGQVEQLEAAQQLLLTQLEKYRAELAQLTAAQAETATERRHGQARIRELEQAYTTLEKATQEKEEAIEALNAQLTKIQNHRESD
ncbi:MAG: DNA-binding protein [Candidatus Thiodiazotropha taylori]|nr:DNA-binding protein [Candidatus Thiodiazotropha taylori]